MVFVAMVLLWGVGHDARARFHGLAFLGLGALLGDRRPHARPTSRKQGDVLATFIWFAVLFTLSNQLNELGFMGFVG